MGACTRRISAGSIGTKATSLATDRSVPAAWCMPSPQAGPTHIKPLGRPASAVRSASFVRATHLDPGDLRTAAALMLPTAVVLPLLPGHAGFPCPLRTLTGIPCPLCGMTTSVEDTVRLRLHDALSA